jgi:hypothetical protein
MRIRQVALVARELDAVVEDLCAVLGIQVAYRDPGVATFGLANAVMPLGDSFLEVVSPVREGTTAGRFLERRRGDSGYMVIVQVEELESARVRTKQAGVRVVWEVALDDAATIHLHPKDVGGAILSLDWMDPPGSWRWAGPDWESKRATEVVSGISGVELEARDPAAMAERWARVLDRPARARGDVFEIAVNGGSVRVVSAGARGEGLRAVDVVAVDRPRALSAARERGLETDGESVVVCGTRLRLVGA